MARFCSPSSTGSASGAALGAAGPDLMALELCKTAVAVAQASRQRKNPENVVVDIAEDLLNSPLKSCRSSWLLDCRTGPECVSFIAGLRDLRARPAPGVPEGGDGISKCLVKGRLLCHLIHARRVCAITNKTSNTVFTELLSPI